MKLFNMAHIGLYRVRFVIALVLMCIMLVLRYSGIGRYINLTFIWEHKETFHEFINVHYGMSVIFFLSLYIIVVALTVPISIILNIVAGYFFGVFQAVIYSNIGSTVGALLAFLTFRYLLHAGMQQKYGKALARFNARFKQQGAYYLLFMQLLPITPFGLINILAGLSGISMWTFYWTTAVGILPGSVIYAFAGSRLVNVTSVGDILSLPVIIALTLLALLALLPVILTYFKIIPMRK